MIRAEPGLGKSTLVEDLLRRASELGYRTEVGRSSELEQQRPLAALIDAFSGMPGPEAKRLLSLLMGAAGDTAGPASFDRSFQVIEECLGFVESVVADGPFVLVLEDLHWADPATHLFFRHAASRLTAQQLLLVGTRRPWPPVPDLDRVEEMRHVTTLVLDPLSEENILSLAERALGGAPQGELLDRLRATSGNPLFAQEALVAASKGDGWENFERSIVRRLTYLSRECFEVLRIASVLGTRFRFSDVTTVTGKRPLELTPIVEEALQSGLLREDGKRLRFNHDLVRDAIYRNIPAGAREELHLEVARELVEAGGSVADIAAHFSLGATRRDELAAGWIWRAGRESAARSPAAAVGLLTRALELAPEGYEQRDLLLSDLVSALLWSGHFDEAESRAREILDRPSAPDARASVRYSLGRVLAYRGRVAESLEQAEAALGEEGLADAQRARLLADVGLRALVMGHTDRATDAVSEAIDVAEHIADPASLALALCACSRIADHRGDLREAIISARRANSIAKTHQSDAIHFVQPPLYLGLALISGDRFDEAADILERGRRTAESVGASWSLPLFHLALALARFHPGSWDEALAEAEAGLALSEETTVQMQVWAPWTRSIVARVNVHRGDLEAAEKEIAAIRGLESAAGSPQFGGYWIRWSEALLHEARGDREKAAATLGTEWDRWPDGEPVGDHRETAEDMIRLAIAVGDARRAGQVEAASVEAALRWRSLSSQARALGCRGWLQRDAGLLRQAGSLFESCRRLLPAAQCLEAAAEVDPAGAPDLLRSALGIYDSLGATWDTARVEAVLRAKGIRRGRSGPRRRPSHGWESLTDTEVKVVSLVAEGLTNRQIAERLFISHRTVGTHVSHVLAKLGVSARTELAVEAARRSV